MSWAVTVAGDTVVIGIDNPVVTVVLSQEVATDATGINARVAAAESTANAAIGIANSAGVDASNAVGAASNAQSAAATAARNAFFFAIALG